MTPRALAALVAVVAVALLAAPPGLASEAQPTLSELEGEVYCPTCKTLLSVSTSPIAERMRDYIRQRIAAGATKTEIKDALVAQFGESVLAAPPKKGFNLLAWVLPFVGVAVAGAVIAALVWRWSRSSRTGGAPRPAPGSGEATPALDPSLERRLDEELARFDG